MPSPRPAAIAVHNDCDVFWEPRRIKPPVSFRLFAIQPGRNRRLQRNLFRLLKLTHSLGERNDAKVTGVSGGTGPVFAEALSQSKVKSEGLTANNETRRGGRPRPLTNLAQSEQLKTLTKLAIVRRAPTCPRSQARTVRMPLSLDACAVGNVTIIRCTGRIVAGADADGLRRRVSALLPDCREIVLHLGNVAFVDSTGMGTLARLLTSARRCGGDLRLCNVGGEVLKVLQITRLNTLFQILQSEEDAVSSFSQGMPGRHAARV